MPPGLKPMRTTRPPENPPFGGVTAEDRLRYEGKWIVAYLGKIRGVGRTLEVALRRASLPKGAEPYIEQVPAAEFVY